MTYQSLFRTLAAVAVLCTTVAAAPAQAGSITINCDSFTVSGTTDLVITCGSATTAKPVCSVTGPSVGTLGSPITLTASCTGSPTGYTWTGGSCAGANATCTDVQNAAATVTYTVMGTNANGDGAPSSNKNVNWSAAPPPAPSGCSIGFNPNSMSSAGGDLAVSGACTGGGQVTSWSWTMGGATWGNGTANPGTASLPSNSGISGMPYTFTLVACNGTSCAGTVTKTLTVPGTGGSGGDMCGNSSTMIVDLPESGQFPTIDNGGFFGEQVFVGRWKLPTYTGAVPTTKAIVSVSEYGGSPLLRHMTISNQMCDFRLPSDKNGVTGPYNTAQNGTTTSTGIFVNSSKSPFSPPGSTVYVNIRNWDLFKNVPSASPGENANMLVVTQKP
jgi:hypothetical protein